MKAIYAATLILLFILAILAAVGGVVAQENGRRDLAEGVFGPVFLILGGLIFLLCFVGNIVAYGEFWAAGLGRVSRTDRPRIYWTVMGILMILPVGMIVVGVSLLL